VRYADDIVVGMQHDDDAQAFLSQMRERLARFSLSLHAEKTRLIEFGRYAAEARKRRGMGRPETFTFLGFTHICGTDRKGRFLLTRKSRRDRMQATLRAIRAQLTLRMHHGIPAQGRWLAQVVRGYFAYHVPKSGDAALAENTTSSKPEVTHHMDSNGEAGGAVAPSGSHPPSMA
jgi:hypothetical protein